MSALNKMLNDYMKKSDIESLVKRVEVVEKKSDDN